MFFSMILGPTNQDETIRICFQTVTQRSW